MIGRFAFRSEIFQKSFEIVHGGSIEAFADAKAGSGVLKVEGDHSVGDVEAFQFLRHVFRDLMKPVMTGFYLNLRPEPFHISNET